MNPEHLSGSPTLHDLNETMTILSNSRRRLIMRRTPSVNLETPRAIYHSKTKSTDNPIRHKYKSSSSNVSEAKESPCRLPRHTQPRHKQATKENNSKGSSSDELSSSFEARVLSQIRDNIRELREEAEERRKRQKDREVRMEELFFVDSESSKEVVVTEEVKTPVEEEFVANLTTLPASDRTHTANKKAGWTDCFKILMSKLFNCF